MDFIAELARQYSALFVSVCALFLTINQSRVTRKHNRLSVRPHLTTFTERIINPTSEDLETVTSTLSNNGLGPAVINKYELLLDDTPIRDTSPDHLLKLAREVFPIKILDTENYFSVLNPGYILAKDEKLTVAKLCIKRPTQNEYPALQEAHQRFQIRVIYESFYGEKFTYDSRDHMEN